MRRKVVSWKEGDDEAALEAALAQARVLFGGATRSHELIGAAAPDAGCTYTIARPPSAPVSGQYTDCCRGQ